jgi:hypothetical protein
VVRVDDAGLTPLQRKVCEELLSLGGPRPSFDEGLGARVRSDLEAAIGEAAGALPEPGMVVAKSALAQVHACEAHRVAVEQSPFEWSSATARGVIAHKAIELSVGMARPAAPAELVDLAMARLQEDERGPGAFLAAAGDAERAELRAAAADHVYKFTDEFPPLRRAWKPRLESSLIARLCGGRVELRGTIDLAIGQAEGTTARVLIVDFKTGRPSATHVDDLRFYALLETLRVGVPPFRVASWYLDSGHWHAEDVDEDLLAAAARRTADGVRALIDLRLGRRPPAVSPGPVCTWCPARHTCPGARQWAEQREACGMDA